MPSLVNKIKSLKNIFGSNSDTTNSLLELKKTKMDKRNKSIRNLTVLKDSIAKTIKENETIKNSIVPTTKAKINILGSEKKEEIIKNFSRVKKTVTLMIKC